jgi:hypothetical protein
MAGLILGLGGGFIPSRLRRWFVIEISYLHFLLHFLGKTVAKSERRERARGSLGLALSHSNTDRIASASVDGMMCR